MRGARRGRRAPQAAPVAWGARRARARDTGQAPRGAGAVRGRRAGRAGVGARRRRRAPASARARDCGARARARPAARAAQQAAHTRARRGRRAPCGRRARRTASRTARGARRPARRAGLRGRARMRGARTRARRQRRPERGPRQAECPIARAEAELQSAEHRPPPRRRRRPRALRARAPGAADGRARAPCVATTSFGSLAAQPRKSATRSSSASSPSQLRGLGARVCAVAPGRDPPQRPARARTRGEGGTRTEAKRMCSGGTDGSARRVRAPAGDMGRRAIV